MATEVKDKLVTVDGLKTIIDILNILINNTKMSINVYDPQKKCTDIFKYAENVAVTKAKATIDTAYITDIISANISVADLKAGDITISDAMRILSENGNMIVNGETMQFLDKDGNVGIQIGYDGKSNPSLIIKDDSGSVMLDSTGLHESAIPDGLIKDNMVKNGTIGKDKLAFEIETDENGKVITSIGQIYTGDGKKFGVEYTEFVQNTSKNLESLDKKIDEASPYSVYLFTTNGQNLSYGNMETTIYARVYKNGIDVTDNYGDECFIWTRTSSDTDGDTYWNELHAKNGSKTLTVNRSEIYLGASFGCSFSDGEEN